MVPSSGSVFGAVTTLPALSTVTVVLVLSSVSVIPKTQT